MGIFFMTTHFQPNRRRRQTCKKSEGDGTDEVLFPYIMIYSIYVNTFKIVLFFIKKTSSLYFIRKRRKIVITSHFILLVKSKE